jgi:hypothetical protein
MSTISIKTIFFIFQPWSERPQAPGATGHPPDLPGRQEKCDFSGSVSTWMLSGRPARHPPTDLAQDGIGCLPAATFPSGLIFERPAGGRDRAVRWRAWNGALDGSSQQPRRESGSAGRSFLGSLLVNPQAHRGSR